MEELKDGRFLLYFDLLGMQATIDDDIDRAADELGQLHNLLPELTMNAGWELGCHFSDSVILVHQAADAAVKESIRIWQSLFVFDEDDEFEEGMQCLPRGAIVEGSLRIVPRIHWTSQGFKSTARSILLDCHKLLGPECDYDSMQMIFRDQPDEVAIEKQRTADGKLVVFVYLKRLTSEEVPFQILAHDPDGGLDSVEMAELGNITGPALSRAVKISERQGIKGPRVIVELNSPLSPSLERYLVPVPNSSFRELLWTADFQSLDRTLAFTFRASELWSDKLQLPWHRRIHYDALLILSIRGAEVVVANPEDNLEGKYELASLLWSLFGDAVSEMPNSASVVAQIFLTLHKLGIEIPNGVHGTVAMDVKDVASLQAQADLPLRPQLVKNPPE